MTFETLGNPILKLYSQARSSSSPPEAKAVSRNESSTSITDIYHTAQNTPHSSRRQSLAAGMGLQMSKPPPPPPPPIDTAIDINVNSSTMSRRSSQSSPGGTLKRIKSLSDFHLYLSPSRLAHLDVLSDSDSDSDLDIEETPAPRLTRPRPHMQIFGKVAGEDARSYSGRLQAHHAKILDGYKEARMVEVFPGRPTEDSAKVGTKPEQELRAGLSVNQNVPTTPSAPTTPGPPVYPTVSGPIFDNELEEADVQPISAFQSDLNPYYGYPAVLTGTTVRPRYHRNRKRDLVKTLLFLFILRIQSWRDTFERFLGLNNLGTWSLSKSRALIKDPGTGLIRQEDEKGKGKVVKRVEKDWIWMIITFVLLRGTWARILGGPLDAIGLGGVRDMLGLV
jgi:hypothetical protein